MSSEAVIVELKKRMGYRAKVLGCGDCISFDEDMTTDNFGPGDRCRRNPDIPFPTSKGGSCNRLVEKIGGV